MYYRYAETRVVHATTKRDAQDAIVNTNHEEPLLKELEPVGVDEIIPEWKRLQNRHILLVCSKRAGAVRSTVYVHASNHGNVVWG
jgi:hypothetical protein